jgi:hypothetical protein
MTAAATIRVTNGNELLREKLVATDVLIILQPFRIEGVEYTREMDVYRGVCLWRVYP